LDAGLVTLKLGLLGVFGAFCLGLFIQIVEYYKVPGLRQFFKLYFELSRNTPLIVQLFFLYYALPKIGVLIDAEHAAVVGLIFLGGSYMSAAIGSGIAEVSSGEVEAAKSIGLRKIQVFRVLIAPVGLKNALPSIFANLVFLVKETSVFAAIAVLDLMSVTKDVIGLYYDTDEALFLLVLSYFIILAPFVAIYYYSNRRIKRGAA
jgi:polar amino acid transport system permease protein